MLWPSRVQALQPDCLGSPSGSAAYKLCDLRLPTTSVPQFAHLLNGVIKEPPPYGYQVDLKSTGNHACT